MTFSVNKNILQLEIPIDDIIVVQKPNGIAYLGQVELGLDLAKTLLARQMKEKLTTTRILHHQAEQITRLKRIDQLGDERMLESAHYHIFRLGVNYFILEKYIIFKISKFF
jgi:hypothetical protein